jgi:hypothetical protein
VTDPKSCDDNVLSLDGAVEGPDICIHGFATRTYMRNAYRILGVKPERKRPGRRRHIWEDTQMVLKELVWKVVDWVHFVQDRGQWWAVLMNFVFYKR